jgi:hypothetical protein
MLPHSLYCIDKVIPSFWGRDGGDTVILPLYLSAKEAWISITPLQRMPTQVTPFRGRALGQRPGLYYAPKNHIRSKFLLVGRTRDSSLRRDKETVYEQGYLVFGFGLACAWERGRLGRSGGKRATRAPRETSCH